MDTLRHFTKRNKNNLRHFLFLSLEDNALPKRNKRTCFSGRVYFTVRADLIQKVSKAKLSVLLLFKVYQSHYLFQLRTNSELSNPDYPEIRGGIKKF